MLRQSIGQENQATQRAPGRAQAGGSDRLVTVHLLPTIGSYARRTSSQPPLVARPNTVTSAEGAAPEH